VIQDVTVRNGNAAGAGTAGDGGGIRARDGVLDLRRSIVTGNRAARNGGGIASDSVFVITIADSTIGENAASGAGGGVSFQEDTNARLSSSLIRGNRAPNGGGLRIFDARPTIESVTVSGNDAASEGGGVLVGGNLDRKIEISLSTIVNNEAATGGGLRVLAPAPANPGATIEIDNSIVANNTGGDCTPGRITSRGYNLSSSSTCGFTATGDLSGVDPKIGALANNGGPTQTHALLISSPALDAGDPAVSACSPTDQRGLPRPKDGNGDGQARCDIGAFEQQTPLHPPCSPRPRFVQRVRPLGNGVLEVVLEAGTTSPQPGNLLSLVRVTRLSNARVSVDGQASQTVPHEVAFTPGRQSVVMIVQRVQPGAATTVSYEIVDLCGTWRTFVGGGPGAF
jgi:predicted outer membrane repeat protein